ncbi:SAV_915 family protein [Streptomyces sp. NPDC048751]|uniref:SAV_915 family protein n=1 Tax=Streptomyces sp. NPDC048751 TaxID=3365591 RepID=UPI003714FF47
MSTPIRSRLLDYLEADPPQTPAPPCPSGPEPRRSPLLDYADEQPVEAARPEGPKPGVPPYHTPVFVPAHPRYVEATDESGTPTRVPFIAYELFEHPTDGTVALAFTSLDRLVAALGEAQPWVVTSLGPLAEGVGGQGVTVRLNPHLAPGPPNWHPADLAAYAREVR